MAKDNKSEIEQPREEVKSKSQEKPVSMVKVMFRENRKFDLHIGRQMITFKGRETKEIPVPWVQHKDFESVKKYFVVKGVNNGRN